MCAYAEALMSVTWGGFLLLTGGRNSEVSRLDFSRIDGGGADDGRVSTRGDILASSCDS